MWGAEMVADLVLLLLIVMVGGLFFLGIPALGFYASQLESGETITGQHRRWRRNSLALAGIILVASWELDVARTGNALPGTFATWVRVALVALLGCALIWSCYRWLKERDELLRRIEVEALALSFGLLAVSALAASQLRATGVVEEIRWQWVVLGSLAVHGISRTVVRARYR